MEEGRQTRSGSLPGTSEAGSGNGGPQQKFSVGAAPGNDMMAEMARTLARRLYVY